MHTMSLKERRQRVVAAIRRLESFLLPANRTLLMRLQEELRAIDNGERDLAACVQKTLRWLNGLMALDIYLAEVHQDPLNEFDGLPPSNRPEVGKQIFLLRAEVGGTFKDLSELRRFGAQADPIIDDLLYTGALHRAEPSPQPEAAPQPGVGVLLPVRLETRFYPPDGNRSEWRLRVRVVPDEPLIDRHDPIPFEAELESVEWLWQNAPGGLNTPAGRIAWQQFAARHGPGRAAWLARTFPPLPPDAAGVIRVDRPAVVRTEPAPSRVRGLPTTIELWMVRGGGLPVHVASTTVDPARLRLDFPDPTDPADQRWWSSWDEAVSAGLGVEISLGAAFPGDIDALYAVGLGEEESSGLFQAHRDQGALGLIEPGTPTNTVDGDPAASLGQDPETWREIVANPGAIGWGSQEVSRALTGRPDSLGPLPGDGFAHREVAHKLIQALWMVLWGHALKDLWGLGPEVYLAGLWAGEFLAPEGPLPTLRVNDQPYGLLPITSLNDFRPSDGSGDFAHLEARLLPALREAQNLWARAAETGGNVSGADTQRLLELLGRTPSANDYAFRYFLSLELLELLYYAFDGALDLDVVDEWWRETTATLERFEVRPTRRYVSFGWPQDLSIPLVAPPEVPREITFKEFLSAFLDPSELVEGTPAFWLEVGGMRPFDRLPASLLARLLLLAKFVAAAEVHRAAQGQTRPALEPLGADENALTHLAQDALAMTDQDLGAAGWAADLHDRVTQATLQLMEQPVGELERVFRSVLDTAAYRLDPWITALAWRRLQESSAAARPFYLGIYGWVDAPQPGTPGPTNGGLLHAPSEPQALAAVILRDKAIHDPEAGRWDMNLESSTIRLADRIGEEVRLGAHLGEVLGREVERIAATAARVEQLRQAFPLRAEHAGRRVCDGLAVLQADPASLPLDPGQIAALEPLRQALDTYGDLLVAEAIYHVVSGRDEAAAAMDAAAGLAAPPKLEVISTRRTGRAVNTNVVIALPPAPDPPEDLHSSPGQLADPAVAAFLADTLGPPHAPPWRWPVLTPDAGPQDFFLSDTGLAIVDTLGLSEEELVRIVLMNAPAGSLLDRRWRLQRPDGTQGEIRLSALGLANELIQELTDQDLEQQILNLEPAGSRVVGTIPAEGTTAQRKARRLAAVLGRQPAIPADLVDTAAMPDDTAVRAELLARYTRLRNVAVLLQAELAARARSSTETAQIEALTLAARWGITPVVQASDTLADRVRRAAEGLQQRIDRSPVAADIAELDALRLAAEIAELAAPEGQLPVLSRIDLSGWPTAFTAAPQLDDAWLAVNAAVREPLARLEGEQLDGLLSSSGSPFVAWTNRPGDPWQVDVSVSASGAKPPTRLIALYGVGGLLPEAPDNAAIQPTIAAGLLDSWGETVPDVDQATTAAFGFNAPAARAPQAILLVAPPVVDDPLTTDVLVNAVADARRLARARMATPGDLGRLAAGLPLMMLPGSGVTGVPLT